MESQNRFSMRKTHDVIVIGGGSAGYAAARTARDAGADVAIVDQGPLGGLCILRSAEVASLMRRAKEFGLSPVEVRAGLSAIVDRKNELVREFAEYRIQQLRDSGLTLYQSRARFRSSREIEVDGATLSAHAFVIVTGSNPYDPSIPGLAEAGYYTSDTILDLCTQPSSLIVLGAGPVALELGQFFARIGTKVTILQRAKTTLSEMDKDVGLAVTTALRDEGLAVVTDAELVRMTHDGGLATVWVKRDGQETAYRGEAMLQALGRRPNVEGLHLKTAGVKMEEGRIVVDAAMRTSQSHIYAVGDVNDVTPIVHLAIQQGEIAAYNATHPGKPAKELDHRLDAEVVLRIPRSRCWGSMKRARRLKRFPISRPPIRSSIMGKRFVLAPHRAL